MRSPPAVLWVLLLLQVLDLATTAWGQREGVKEANPAVEWLLSWGGYAGFALVKVLFVLVAAFLLNWSWSGAGPWVLHGVNVAYVVVVTGNLLAILGGPAGIAWIAAAAFAVLWPRVPRGVVPALPARKRFVDAAVVGADYASTTVRRPAHTSPSYR